MTEVMKSCDSSGGDFSIGGDFSMGGASGEKRIPFQNIFTPSIVVDLSEGGEVESGELRWPPEHVCCHDNNDPGDHQPQAADLPAEEEEPVEPLRGGVSD